jgi:acyl-coenzyme A thioesterase PaaI-like protein
MPSNSIQAAGHRARQRTIVYMRPVKGGKVDYVHGEVVTNRRERRAALAQAKVFGCDPNGEHTPKCPKYVEPEKKREKPPEVTA